jgi:sugar/nucleoside kinase (ribokinase family)
LFSERVRTYFPRDPKGARISRNNPQSEQLAILIRSLSCVLFCQHQVEAVDTVGAGDAFLGSLSAYLAACPEDLPAAIQKALRVATISVTRQGAQSSYPYASELPEDLRIAQS